MPISPQGNLTPTLPQPTIVPGGRPRPVRARSGTEVVVQDPPLTAVPEVVRPERFGCAARPYPRSYETRRLVGWSLVGAAIIVLPYSRAMSAVLLLVGLGL